MAVSRDTLIALAALALWLTLGALLSRTELDTYNAVFRVGSVSVVLLVVARVVLDMSGSGKVVRALRKATLVVWVLLGAAAAVLFAFFGLWEGPHLDNATFIALATGTALLGGLVAGVGWWAADRLDRIGVDGVFILALPEVAYRVADWHVDTVNYVLSGLISPWHALGEPLLPMLAVLVVVLIRPPEGGARLIGAWAPRTVLPYLLLPPVVQAFGAGFMPHSLALFPGWVGAAAAIALSFRAPRGERRLHWPLLLFAGVPVVAFAVGASIWGSIAFNRRYAGDDTAVWRVGYAIRPTDADLDTLRDRVSRAYLSGEVEREGDEVRITLYGVSASHAEWWLRRYGARRGLVQVRRESDFSEDDARALAGPSDRPETWPAPPPGHVWAHRRCPGSRCEVHLLDEETALPDNPFEDAEIVFRPKSFRADVRLDLRSTVPPDRPQYAVVTLDDQLIGRVNADRSADALWFDHTHPGYARRVAEALVGRQLEAGDMTALTLEEVR